MKSPMQVIDEMMDSAGDLPVIILALPFFPLIAAYAAIWFVWEFVRISFSEKDER